MVCGLPDSLRSPQVFKVARFGDPYSKAIFEKKTALKSLKGIPIFAAEP